MGNQRLDIETSLFVAASIAAEPNACWGNAWDALVDFPDFFLGGAYIEGWLVIETETEIHIIEHGWCHMADRCVVDPTIVFLAGDWRTACYFAGYRLSSCQVAQIATGRTIPLPVVRNSGYRENGLEHADYRCAYEAARKEADARSKVLQRPIVWYRMAIRAEVTISIKLVEN
jgi:hypothetical protein